MLARLKKHSSCALVGHAEGEDKKKTTKSPKGLLDEFLLHFLRSAAHLFFFVFFCAYVLCPNLSVHRCARPCPHSRTHSTSTEYKQETMGNLDFG